VRLRGRTGEGADMLRVDADRASFDRLGLGAVVDPHAALAGLGAELRT
jgi:hypothetical protein